MSTIKPTSVPSKRLSVSINASSTSIQLNNILSWAGLEDETTELTPSDFGTVLYAVLRDSSNSRMEIVEIDPATIANDEITLTRRGLKFTGDLLTEVTANKLTWVKNETIVELGSDTPQLFQWLKEYIDDASIAGAVPADQSTTGIVRIASAAQIDADTATEGDSLPLAMTPDQLALSKYYTRLPSVAEKAFLTTVYASMTGMISPYGGRSAPTGFLLCNGASVSRTTYAALFAVLNPSGTFTVTIASPAVFTKTAHGFVAGDKIHFTTTGTLPTGLSTATDYFVVSTGLTADDFRVSLSPEGVVVNTSATQSGTHTVYYSSFGKGDGLTTFSLPAFGGRVPVGVGSSTVGPHTFDSVSSIDTGTDIITLSPNKFYTGTAVTITGSDLPIAEDSVEDSFSLGSDGTVSFSTANYVSNNDKVRIKSLGGTSALTDEAIYYVVNATSGTCQLSTTLGGSVTGTGDAGSGSFVRMLSTYNSYYIIRTSSTTLQLASTRANAISGVEMNITSTGSGTGTITGPTFTKTFAEDGGEEEHFLSIEEMPAHTHGGVLVPGDGGGAGGEDTDSGTTASTGGDDAHNNLQPFLAVNYIIKT